MLPMLEQQVSGCQVQVDPQQLHQLPVQLRINIMPPSLQHEHTGVQVSSSMQAQHLQHMLDSHTQQWGLPGVDGSDMQQLPQLHQAPTQRTTSPWPSLELQQQQAAQQQMYQHTMQQQQPLQQQEAGQTSEQQLPEGVFVTPVHTSQQRARMQGTPPSGVLAASPCSAPGQYSGTPPATHSPLSAPPPGMCNWPAGFFSPASCWSVPTAEQFAAMSAAAAAHSTVSCVSGNLGMFNVVKKYKRAKTLLQTQLQETQRLKQVVDMECQKATAAGMHAKALEAQLAASTAAVQEAQRAQFELQQQVEQLRHNSKGGADNDKQEQLQQLNQRLQELDQLNSQLQFKYELAAKELALQQQLSRDLTQQLEAAEEQLQQAQEEQQGLLAELRHQQQLQLEMRLEQPAAEHQQDERLESLQQQLAGVQCVVADKERNLQELTVKWNEAATHVEELQLQLQQESRNHQLLLRASQDSWAAHHARLLTRLEQQLDEVDTAEAEAKAASAAAQATMAELHIQERRRLQLQHQELEHVVENLEQKVEQLERDGAVKQQQQEELTNMCAQLLDQQEAAQAAVLKAATIKEELEQAHQQQLDHVKAEHAAALSQLEQQHQAALQQHQQQVVTLEAEHAAALAQLEHHHQGALHKLEQTHQQQLSALKAEHAAALAQLEEQHQGAFQELEWAVRKELGREHRRELAELREALAMQMQAELQMQREEDSAAHAAVLKELQEAHEADRAAVFDAHRYALTTQQQAHEVELDVLSKVRGSAAGELIQLQQQLLKVLASSQLSSPQQPRSEQQEDDSDADAAPWQHLVDQVQSLVSQQQQLQKQLQRANAAAAQAVETKMEVQQKLQTAEAAAASKIAALQQQLADVQASAALEAADLHERLAAARAAASTPRDILRQSQQQGLGSAQREMEALRFELEAARAAAAAAEAARKQSQAQLAAARAEVLSPSKLSPRTPVAASPGGAAAGASPVGDPAVLRQQLQALQSAARAAAAQAQQREEALEQQLAATQAAADSRVEALQVRLLEQQADADAAVSAAEQQHVQLHDELTAAREAAERRVQALQQQLAEASAAAAAAAEAHSAQRRALQQQLQAAQEAKTAAEAAAEAAKLEVLKLTKQLGDMQATVGGVSAEQLQQELSALQQLLQQALRDKAAAEAAHASAEAALTAAEERAAKAADRHQQLTLSERHIADLQEQLAHAATNATQLQQQLASALEQLDAQAAAAAGDQEGAATVAKLHEQLAASAERIQQLQHDLASAHAELEADQKQAAEQVADWAATLADLKQQQQLDEAERERLEAQAEASDALAAELQQQLAVEASRVAALQEQLQASEDRTQQLEQQAAALAAKAAGLEEELKVAAQHAVQLQKMVDTAEAEVQASVQLAASKGAAAAVASQQVAQLQQQVAELQGQLSTAQHQQAALQVQLTEVQQQLSTAQAAAADAQQPQLTTTAASDAVSSATLALHEMASGFTAAVAGLQHQLVLAEAKARLLEPLAHRKGLQVQQLTQQLIASVRQQSSDDTAECDQAPPPPQQQQQQQRQLALQVVAAAGSSSVGAAAAPAGNDGLGVSPCADDSTWSLQLQQELAQGLLKQQMDPVAGQQQQMRQIMQIRQAAAPTAAAAAAGDSDELEELSSMIDDLQQQLWQVEREDSRRSTPCRSNSHAQTPRKQGRTPQSGRKQKRARQQHVEGWLQQQDSAASFASSGVEEQEGEGKEVGEGLRASAERLLRSSQQQQRQRRRWPLQQSAQASPAQQQQPLQLGRGSKHSTEPSPAQQPWQQQQHTPGRVSYAELSSCSSFGCSPANAGAYTPQEIPDPPAGTSGFAAAGARAYLSSSSHSPLPDGTPPGVLQRQLFSSVDSPLLQQQLQPLSGDTPTHQHQKQQRLLAVVASPAVERSPEYVLHHNLLFDLPAYDANLGKQGRMQANQAQQQQQQQVPQQGGWVVGDNQAFQFSPQQQQHVSPQQQQSPTQQEQEAQQEPFVEGPPPQPESSSESLQHLEVMLELAVAAAAATAARDAIRGSSTGSKQGRQSSCAASPAAAAAAAAGSLSPARPAVASTAAAVLARAAASPTLSPGAATAAAAAVTAAAALAAARSPDAKSAEAQHAAAEQGQSGGVHVSQSELSNKFLSALRQSLTAGEHSWGSEGAGAGQNLAATSDAGAGIVAVDSRVSGSPGNTPAAAAGQRSQAGAEPASAPADSKQRSPVLAGSDDSALQQAPGPRQASSMPAGIAQLLQQLQQQYRRCQAVEQELLLQQQQHRQQQQDTPGKEQDHTTPPSLPVQKQQGQAELQSVIAQLDIAGQATDAADRTPADPQAVLLQYQQAVSRALAGVAVLQRIVVQSSKSHATAAVSDHNTDQGGLQGAGQSQAHLQRWQQPAEPEAGAADGAVAISPPAAAVAGADDAGGSAVPGTPWKQDLCSQLQKLQQQLLQTQERLQKLEDRQVHHHHQQQQRQQQEGSAHRGKDSPRDGEGQHRGGSNSPASPSLRQLAVGPGSPSVGAASAATVTMDPVHTTHVYSSVGVNPSSGSQGDGQCSNGSSGSISCGSRVVESPTASATAATAAQAEAAAELAAATVAGTDLIPVSSSTLELRGYSTRHSLLHQSPRRSDAAVAAAPDAAATAGPASGHAAFAIRSVHEHTTCIAAGSETGSSAVPEGTALSTAAVAGSSKQQSLAAGSSIAGSSNVLRQSCEADSNRSIRARLFASQMRTSGDSFASAGGAGVGSSGAAGSRQMLLRGTDSAAAAAAGAGSSSGAAASSTLKWVLENAAGAADDDTGSVDGVSIDQYPELPRTRVSGELVDNHHSKQLQYLQQRQWERRRAAGMLSPRAAAAATAAAGGSGITGHIGVRASSPFAAAAAGAAGEDSRVLISADESQYVRLEWGAEQQQYLQQQGSLGSMLAASQAVFGGSSAAGPAAAGQSQWVHVPEPAGPHKSPRHQQQHQQQGYQPKIVRGGSLGDAAGGGVQGIGSKRTQQQQPRHSVGPAQAGSYWQKGLRSPDHPSPLRTRKSPQQQQRSPSRKQQQMRSPARSPSLRQPQRKHAVAAKVDTSPPVVLKLPGRQPGAGRSGGSYILQHERMLQHTCTAAEPVSHAPAVQHREQTAAPAHTVKGAAPDASPTGRDRSSRVSCPASPAAAALQAAAAAAAKGADHAPQATASRAAAKASRPRSSASGGQSQSPRHWQQQWQQQQQQQLGIRGLSTSCSWAEQTPEKLILARAVSPQLRDSMGHSASRKASTPARDDDDDNGSDVSPPAGRRCATAARVAPGAIVRDVDSLPLTAHVGHHQQQHGASGRFSSGAGSGRFSGGGSGGFRPSQRDRLSRGASSSDDDEDNDNDVAGRGLRSSGSGVMSSAARQAALKQLQQYQNAWRWSQQADRD